MYDFNPFRDRKQTILIKFGRANGIVVWRASRSNCCVLGDEVVTCHFNLSRRNTISTRRKHGASTTSTSCNNTKGSTRWISGFVTPKFHSYWSIMVLSFTASYWHRYITALDIQRMTTPKLSFFRLYISIPYFPILNQKDECKNGWIILIQMICSHQRSRNYTIHCCIYLNTFHRSWYYSHTISFPWSSFIFLLGKCGSITNIPILVTHNTWYLHQAI